MRLIFPANPTPEYLMASLYQYFCKESASVWALTFSSLNAAYEMKLIPSVRK
jgi:hypothetical protein